MGKTKKNSSKEIDVKEVIQQSVKEAARGMVQELKLNNMIKPELSYFKRVELLLHHYNDLKKALKNKEEDIKYIKQHGLPEKSGSIVVYQTGGRNITGQERYSMLIEKYELEKLETLREINRIDNAIDVIKRDKYFIVLELKYFSEKKWNEEEIAEELNKDQSTINRNKKRLINKLKTILFPESIKEIS